MMKYIIVFLLSVLQFSGIILAIILEDLYDEKMGVARYLIFKKQEFAAGYFAPAYMNVYTLILAGGAIVCFALLLIKWKSGKRMVSLLLAVLANSIGIMAIHMNLELDAYHFFLIGIFIVIAFQYGWCIRSYRKTN
ncbi:hypothetical protein [Bacillus sp. FJAT-29814]|uniref:hypothetical protein n=1 Tax=Bacillus sp. FJAT-29814 TaxID=1729688 RepID=UPI000835B474|nr:hypothetical protein [Bacillus sp. FJAT-29814]